MNYRSAGLRWAVLAPLRNPCLCSHPSSPVGHLHSSNKPHTPRPRAVPQRPGTFFPHQPQSSLPLSLRPTPASRSLSSQLTGCLLRPPPPLHSPHHLITSDSRRLRVCLCLSPPSRLLSPRGQADLSSAESAAPNPEHTGASTRPAE